MVLTIFNTTLLRIFYLGITAKIGYAPSGAASVANDFKAAGAVNDRIATPDTASAGGITLDGGGDSVTHYQVKAAPIDGLSIGADYRVQRCYWCFRASSRVWCILQHTHLDLQQSVTVRVSLLYQ